MTCAHLFTFWVKANLPFLGSSLGPTFPIRNAPNGSELGAWTGTKPCWLKTAWACSVLPQNNRDHEWRVLSLLLCQLTTKMTLTVLGNFCLILVVCSCPIRIVTCSLYDCWQRGGWGLCGKRLWETHITVMTMVWQCSAAKECMDGMLLLIKDIFSPHLWLFHRFSVASINPLWFKCWDLALNTRAGMPRVHTEQHVRAATHRWKEVIKAHSSIRNSTGNTCFVLKVI